MGAAYVTAMSAIIVALIGVAGNVWVRRRGARVPPDLDVINALAAAYAAEHEARLAEHAARLEVEQRAIECEARERAREQP